MPVRFQVTDDMVKKAHAEYHKVLGDKDRSDPMRAALEVALTAMWRPMVEAPVDDTQILAMTADGRMMIFNGGILFRIMLSKQPSHLQFPATHWMPLPAELTERDAG